MLEGTPKGLRDGYVPIDGTGDVLRPGMAGAEFQQMRFVQDAGYREGTYTGTARLGVQRVLGRAFHTSFVFRRGRLCSVHLAIATDDPADTSWDSWDHGREMDRKKTHEAWAALHLGEPLTLLVGKEGDPEAMRGRIYPWGAVRSIYDGRAGSAFLDVSYEPPPAE